MTDRRRFYRGPDRRMVARRQYESAPVRLLCRIWSLIVYSDTTPTRFMLALAASCWAIFLAAPGDTFQRPVYLYMRVVGPEWVWAILWGAHALGMWWRTFSSVPRPFAAAIINTLGVMLFTGATISIFLSLTFPLPAAIAADVVFVMASFWVLIRTHINSEHGWRVD